jgi:hypothetical protein
MKIVTDYAQTIFIQNIYTEIELKLKLSQNTRERRYSSYSFYLGARCGWVVSVMSRPRFSPGERTPGTQVQ